MKRNMISELQVELAEELLKELELIIEGIMEEMTMVIAAVVKHHHKQETTDHHLEA